MSTYSNDITTGGTTTRSDDPEVIRRDIESTRADLSRLGLLAGAGSG